MHAKKTNKTKFAVLLLALALLVGGVVGGTLAWLIDTTDPVVNTFTVGDINIELTESENLDLKMIPGDTITKDPKVTVKGGSEACWLFVKIEEGNFPNFLQYSVDDTKIDDAKSDWELLESGVYYREVAASENKQEFYILTNNEVKVGDDATKSDLAEYKENKPTLTFTAYAVQKANIDSAADAWSVATTGKLPTTTP